MAISLSTDSPPPATRPAIEKQAPKKGSNIQVLDGLRAIAILLVIGFHIQQKNPNVFHVSIHPQIGAIWIFGASGVNLFFLLSGFLLFMPYARAFLFQAKWPSMRQFYLRRALRILPAYYIALAVDVVVFQPQYLQPDHWKQLFLFLTLFMDSTTTTYQQLNGPFWTLAVEWQFYMLLPLVMLGFLFVLKRLKPSPRLRLGGVLGLCCLIVVYGIIMRYIGSLYAHKPGTNIIATIVLDLLYGTGGKYFENFAIGMAISGCYIYTQQVQSSFFNHWVRRLSPLILGAGCLILYFAAAWTLRLVALPHTSYFSRLALLDHAYNAWSTTIIALGYGSCMFALLFSPKIVRFPLETRLLQKLALISYGLYMWHLPFVLFFHDHVLPTLGNLAHDRYKLYVTYWVCVLLVVFPIAITSYMLIEKPCMAFSHKKRPLDKERPLDKKVQIDQITTIPQPAVQPKVVN